MKKYISLAFIVAFSLGISSSIKAETLPSADQIVAMFKDMREKACQRGDLFAGKFTLRSFSGMLCTVPAIAKVALALCSNKGCDAGGNKCFNESSCAAAARTNAPKADMSQVQSLVNKTGLDVKF